MPPTARGHGEQAPMTAQGAGGFGQLG